MGIDLKFGINKNIKIPMELKRRCTKAILNAAFETVSAANIAVTVVPKFAPIKNENTLLKGIALLATSGTNKEVVIELDCTAIVNTTPQKKVSTGLENTYFSIFSSVLPTIANLKYNMSSLMDTNNSKMDTNIPIQGILEN